MAKKWSKAAKLHPATLVLHWLLRITIIILTKGHGWDCSDRRGRLTEEHLISLLATRLHIGSVEGVCDEQGGTANAFQRAAIKVTERDEKKKEEDTVSVNMTGDKFEKNKIKSHHVRTLTFLSCGWSPQRKQSPPLHPSQFSKLFLRSCDQLGAGWWKGRDLFLLRREDAKDISLADSRGDFSPLCTPEPTFQVDNLGVFQLLYLVKSTVNVVKREKCEIFTVVSGLCGEKGDMKKAVVFVQ